MAIRLKRRNRCYYLSTRNKKSYETTDWIVFYFRKHFELSYEVCGYFDNRPEINIALFFFHLTIKLPFRNKWTDECDAPKWGIAYHGQTFWIYRGGKGNMNGGNKWWTFDVPWKLDWVRTSNLRKDGKWEHETKKERKSFYEDQWKEVLWMHPCVVKLQKKS